MAESDGNLLSRTVGNRGVAVGGELPTLLVNNDDEGWSNRARFAWDEFFSAEIANPHTRAAYLRSVKAFLAWCEQRRLQLPQITPGLVGEYLGQHAGAIPTKKLALAAIRHFFDTLVVRHVVVLNPAHSVRAERYTVVEGKTPEIAVEQARTLLRSIDTGHVVGLRDKAVLGILVYTAVRVGAVAKLRLKDFRGNGNQFTLRFREKGGKDREIPVRSDLEDMLREYLAAADVELGRGDGPLFRTANGKTRTLTANGVSAEDLCRMVKRRVVAAGLPSHLSPHSFRVAVITDLLTQNVPLEDVQFLAGHADPRTTRLYDRRQRRVTRNVVERISV
jgi:integrase/recombinase XerD